MTDAEKLDGGAQPLKFQQDAVACWSLISAMRARGWTLELDCPPDGECWAAFSIGFDVFHSVNKNPLRAIRDAAVRALK